MKLGVHLVNFSLPGGPETIGPTLAATGRAAEEAGLDNLSFMDHYLQLEFLAGAEDPMLEGYTALGFLAAHTSSVELQLLMTGVTYRHPGLLAKIVSTLDVLSGGRAALGIGAAWYEREHRALGVPFPPLAERFERLEETLQIVRQMWSADNGPFDGRHYSSPRRSTHHSPCGSRTRRSWSVEGARRRRFAWSRSTPTPATSSPVPAPAPRRSRTSSPCCATGASGRADRTTRSDGPCSTTVPSVRTRRRRHLRRGDARPRRHRRRRGARDAPARGPGRLRQVPRRPRRAPRSPSSDPPTHTAPASPARDHLAGLHGQRPGPSPLPDRANLGLLPVVDVLEAQ